MTIAFNPTPIDFSSLSNLGQNIGGALGQHNLGTAMQGAMGPDGKTPDFQKMIAVLAGRGQHVAAAKLLTEQMQADALAGYRRDSLKSPERRLYEDIYGSGDEGPPQPGTVPGVQTAQNGPAQPSQDGKPTMAEFYQGRKGGTPGEIARDKEFGKEVADWQAGGGFTAVNRQLQQLESGVTSLESSDRISGPIVGSLPDAMNYYVNPEAINTRQNIEEAIQSSLRKVLGAQYTQQEGENLLKRTFDPRLQEADNAKRARRVLHQLKTMAATKDDAAKYFEANNGTLRGWNGKLATGQDDIDIDAPAPGEEGAKEQGRLEASPIAAPAPNAGAAPDTRELGDELAGGGYEKQPRTPTPKELQMLRTAVKKHPEQQEAIERAFDKLMGKKDSADFYLRGSR
jgi:hypothetical protein